mgnify:CR=1 FL=1
MQILPLSYRATRLSHQQLFNFQTYPDYKVIRYKLVLSHILLDVTYHKYPVFSGRIDGLKDLTPEQIRYKSFDIMLSEKIVTHHNWNTVTTNVTVKV